MLNKNALFGKPIETPSRDLAAASARPGSTPIAASSPSPAEGARRPVQEAQPAPSQDGGRDESAGARLIVGPNIKLRGVEITDCDTLVVEGSVEATMDSRVIEISERGAYSGTVCIDVAEIKGRFEGELTARQRLVICATGTVAGKIRYGKLVVAEGGTISGDVRAVDAGAPLPPARAGEAAGAPGEAVQPGVAAGARERYAEALARLPT